MSRFYSWFDIRIKFDIEMEISEFLNFSHINQTVITDVCFLEDEIEVEWRITEIIEHNGSRMYKEFADENIVAKHLEGYGGFLVDFVSDRIVVNIETEQLDNGAVNFLFMLPFVLWITKRDYYRIHAATLIIDDKLIMLIGESGAGKSTATYALKDFAMILSDEVSIIKNNNGFDVFKLTNTIKIRKDALRMFDYTSNEDEVYFPLDSFDSFDVGRSLDYIFVLNKVNNAETNISNASLHEVINAITPVSIVSMNEKLTKRTTTGVLSVVHSVDAYKIDFGYDMEIFVRKLRGFLRDR